MLTNRPYRIAVVFLTLLLCLTLFATIARAQGPDEEALREAKKATAATTEGGTYRQIASAMPISAPLFMGVDDATLNTYAVDPATSAAFPLFAGFEVWGAAYAPLSDTIYFNSGSILRAWPVDGIVTTIGTMTSSSDGAVLSFVGLAYHNGTLYGIRNVGSTANPEALYSIDTTTAVATLETTYGVPTTDTDLGGLAPSGTAGVLLATNDDTSFPGGGSGLISLDTGTGAMAFIAPYPAGETDVDGLAYNDGKAYLVTDESGYSYIFDFAVMTYTGVISNPWTTSEIFAGATWVEAEAGGAAITLDKTVGTDSSTCATTEAITVTSGTDVYYCYLVQNTGTVTLTRHTVEDSELGTLISDFSYSLTPGAGAFFTVSTTISATTVNTATWTAYNPGPTDVVSATDSATVNVFAPTAVQVAELRISHHPAAPWGVALAASLLLVGITGFALRRRG